MEAIGAFSDSRQFLGLICRSGRYREILPHQSFLEPTYYYPRRTLSSGSRSSKGATRGNMALFAMALFSRETSDSRRTPSNFLQKWPCSLEEEHVKRLKELRSDIQWRSLAETVIRTHARRRID